jgi:putative SOS response-associated peptidase YedK
MCGRFTYKLTWEELVKLYRLTLDQPARNTQARYNVCPTDPVDTIVATDGKRELVPMRWGLVPFWATESKVAFSTINAKAETLSTSPAFREAFKRRRCLIPLDGFYEWQSIGPKLKQPFAVSLTSGALFALAGLWDRWKDKATGLGLETFTIITTDPNPLMEPFHNRMPVIVKPEDYERWIAPADPVRLPVDLLRPYPEEEMRAWKVASAVGNVRNDNPELIAPLS